MAAREKHAQPLVGDVTAVVDRLCGIGPRFGVDHHERFPPPRDSFGAHLVQCATPGCREQPGGRGVGGPLRGPDPDRRSERFGQCILGKIEPAEPAHQQREEPAPVVLPGPFECNVCVPGRTRHWNAPWCLVLDQYSVIGRSSTVYSGSSFTRSTATSRSGTSST